MAGIVYNVVSRATEQVSDECDDIPYYPYFLSVQTLQDGLESGLQVNKYDKYNCSTAYWACKNESTELLRILMFNGLDVNKIDPFGYTPLYWAYINNRIDMMRLLITGGADINIGFGDDTLLSMSTMHNKYEVAHLLIVSGGDLTVNIRGSSILDICIQLGRDNIFESILGRNVDINENGQGHTSPLLLACRYGRTKMVKRLLENGADVNQQNTDYAPIHEICNNGDIGILEYLLQIPSINIDIVTLYDSYTPLQIACQKNYSEIVIMLLNAGACPNTFVNCSPLDMAYANNNHTLIALFLECGAIDGSICNLIALDIDEKINNEIEYNFNNQLFESIDSYEKIETAKNKYVVPNEFKHQGKNNDELHKIRRQNMIDERKTKRINAINAHRDMS